MQPESSFADKVPTSHTRDTGRDADPLLSNLRPFHLYQLGIRTRVGFKDVCYNFSLPLVVVTC